MTGETLRCFLGLPIPAVEVLLKAATAASAKTGCFRFTDPKLWHLTLAFMPALPRDSISELITLWSGVFTTTPTIQTSITRLGAFPSSDQPEVIWWGLNPDESIRALHAALRPWLPKDIDDRFHPHVTIARVNRNQPDHHKREFFASISKLPFETVPLTLSTVCLYESTLTQAGPRYAILERWTLSDSNC
ncbi:MAG: RNA 2',3'-cyclic phosphodiesterase [Planctomyces sp.]|nr:RNA 2',3'-cyclic phosphodiesterase [Planctomyces sp.]